MANILVIDDKESMREGVAQVLIRMGHEAFTASGGAKGLTIYNCYHGTDALSLVLRRR